MKKQLTIFAAAAMLLSFAGAAFAGTPTVTMSGAFDYSVEFTAVGYSNVADKWNNNADNALKTDPAYVLKFDVAADKLGTLSYELMKNGAVQGWYPGITYTNTLGGATLNLGSVDANWDEMTDGTGNAGAKITKTFGKMTLVAATAGTDSVAINAAKLSAPLNATTNAYAAVVADDAWKGLVYVGGDTKIGSASVVAKGGVEIGDTTGNDKGVFAKMELPVNAAIKVVGKVAYVESGYDVKITNGSDIRKENGDIGIESIGKLAADGKVDAANLFGRADYAWAKDANAYAEVSAFKSTYSAKVGTSYKPLFIDDAFVSTNETNATTFQVVGSKGLTGGATLKVGAGYFNAVAAADSFSGAGVKLSKSFDWLSTYVAASKGWNRGDWKMGAKGDVFQVVVGASTSISF